MSWKTTLFSGLALGAGTLAGVSYLNALRNTAAEIIVVPKASVQQVSWDELTIRLDLQVKNPTRGSLTICFPFVKLLYKDTLIGSSAVVNKAIKIPSQGEVAVANIQLKIPVVNAFSVVFTLVKALIGGQPVSLTLQTQTIINLGLLKLPYETKQDIMLKK